MLAKTVLNDVLPILFLPVKEKERREERERWMESEEKEIGRASCRERV